MLLLSLLAHLFLGPVVPEIVAHKRQAAQALGVHTGLLQGRLSLTPGGVSSLNVPATTPRQTRRCASKGAIAASIGCAISNAWSTKQHNSQTRCVLEFIDRSPTHRATTKCTNAGAAGTVGVCLLTDTNGCPNRPCHADMQGCSCLCQLWCVPLSNLL